MKIRAGFVSNSSSSSFIVNRSLFSDEDVEKIEEKNQSIQYSDGSWYIEVLENEIRFSADMDNFDMVDYLISTFDITSEDIKWVY